MVCLTKIASNRGWEYRRCSSKCSSFTYSVGEKVAKYKDLRIITIFLNYYCLWKKAPLR